MGCFGYICKDCGTAIRGDCWDGGEDCVLIHVRHGEEVGRVQGHYNEYGGVIEESKADENVKFRGDGEKNPNSHKRICESEMDMNDSYMRISKFKEFDGEWIDFRGFYRKMWMKDIKRFDYDLYKLPYINEIVSKAVSDREFSDSLNTYNAIRKKYIFVDVEAADIEESIFHLEGIAEILFNELVWNFYYMEDKYFRKEFDKLPNIKVNGYSGVVAYHSLCYRRAVRKNTFNLVPSEPDPNQSWGKPRKKYK